MGYMETVESALRAIREGSACPVLGCQESDVAGVEASCGVQLPEAYRRFLLGAGSRAGDFMVGSDLDVTVLGRIQRGVQDLASESGVVLPVSAFAFLSHQGYQYLCFDWTQGADPFVYFISDDGLGLRPLKQTFSQWLLSAVCEELGHRSV